MGPEGAKHPHGPSHNSASAAGKANAPAAGAGLAGLWQQLTNRGGSAVSTVQQQVAQVAKTVQRQKWSMPVDVKIDFLRPTFETVKETLTTAWVQLPPPIQQAAPYVGVAVGSGLVVFLIQQRSVNHHVSVVELHFFRLVIQETGLNLVS